MTDQYDADLITLLDEPPTHPPTRREDPETSHAAADTVTHIRESQRLILTLLRLRPMTSEQIETAWIMSGYPPISPSGLRTRRRELYDLGLVVDTGYRDKTEAGRQSIVWGLAPDDAVAANRQRRRASKPAPLDDDEAEALNRLRSGMPLLRTLLPPDAAMDVSLLLRTVERITS